jgi:hypothetical protein
MRSPEEFIHVNLTMLPAQLPLVYALLGGASLAAATVARGSTAAEASNVKGDPALPIKPSTATEPAAEPAAAATTGERDAAGTLFDSARHTGTKVKSGLWRMKTGLSRGAGEGEDAIPATGAAAQASTDAAASGSAAGAAATSTAAVDDDEFAAFTAAASAGAPVAAKARTWSDADLSKLTNQAAQKLGSPDKVRETIARFVPEGQTPHSRNIPADQREPFAVALEAAAGIQYEG